MFFWTVSGRQIVLTDDEEKELPRRAGFSASESIGVMIADERGRKLQKRLGAYLEAYAASQPQEFFQEYVDRRGYGPQDLQVLQALVHAYGITHRRAVWGVVPGISIVDQGAMGLWFARRPDVAYITLTAPTRTWLLRRAVHPIGLLGFPGADIEKIAGTSDQFVLITSRMSIRFGPDAVRIFSLPDGNEFAS
jgi:hypothetical protein